MALLATVTRHCDGRLVMNDIADNFIRARRIDSFQKLRFILFLHQHPDLAETCQGFAHQLYLGDCPLVDEIISDLCRTGIVDCVGGRFKLHNDPDIRSCLRCLAQAFENPLTRQRILDQVQQNKFRAN